MVGFGVGKGVGGSVGALVGLLDGIPLGAADLHVGTVVGASVGLGDGFPDGDAVTSTISLFPSSLSTVSVSSTMVVPANSEIPASSAALFITVWNFPFSMASFTASTPLSLRFEQASSAASQSE